MVTRKLKRRPGVLIAGIIFLFVLLSVATTDATEIKWTPGTNDNGNKAAAAPRSQNYWDEHGIERPDYAKTDAEIAKEKGESTTGKPFVWILATFAFVGFVVWYHDPTLIKSGSRLGGQHSVLDRFSRQTLTGDEARKARLARFEQATNSNGEKHE